MPSSLTVLSTGSITPDEGPGQDIAQPVEGPQGRRAAGYEARGRRRGRDGHAELPAALPQPRARPGARDGVKDG